MQQRALLHRGSTPAAAAAQQQQLFRCAAARNAGRCRRSGPAPQPGRRGPLPARANNNEDDLMQFPDRARWYEAKFAAEDMPDWTVATLIRRTDLAPGVAALTLGIEVSRERVPLRNAYVAAGQLARLRANSGVERLLPVASPPPGVTANKEALFRTRGDIFAGETKSTREPVSTEAELEVVVEAKAAPELYAVQLDDTVEVGPFEGGGLNLREAGVLAAFRFPTLVLLVSGAAGIASARALLESPPDMADLALELRTDVVVYYSVPNESSVLYRDRFKVWAERGPVRVVVTTRGFADAFDGDDSLLYDPDTTAAIILVGGDAEAEAEAREVCAEAEIATFVSDSAPAPAPVYLDATPKSFKRWEVRTPGAAGGGEGAGDEEEEEQASDDEEGAPAAAGSARRAAR